MRVTALRSGEVSSTFLSFEKKFARKRQKKREHSNAKTVLVLKKLKIVIEEQRE